VSWQPIETVPKGKDVLLWWIPKDPNPYAEACVIGMVSAHEPGMWWNGQRGAYQSVSHVTHWMPLPESPRVAKAAPEQGKENGHD
jgi:hypothetical protein